MTEQHLEPMCGKYPEYMFTPKHMCQRRIAYTLIHVQYILNTHVKYAYNLEQLPQTSAEVFYQLRTAFPNIVEYLLV